MQARAIAVGSLVLGAIALQMIGAGVALAGGNDPAGLSKTTASTLANANRDKKQACDKAASDESKRVAAAAALAKAIAVGKPAGVIASLQAALTAKTATAAASAAGCATATANAVREAASFAGESKGIASDVGAPTLPDTHQTANGAFKSANMQWLSNSRGTNGNFAGANFIHYENLGYDFLFGDGTGGLSIFSLKDKANPVYVASVPASALMQPADPHQGRNHDCFSAVPPCPAGTVEGLPADTQARFYEGENPTVDSKRKIAYLARDPRSFGNNNHPNGRTGLYIIDVKDPFHPVILAYQWVPAGHTATCINDCRYIWSMGPANNGSRVNGSPQDIAGVLHPDWAGVPVFVTDVRDPLHPYTYAKVVDALRNNNHTDYTHSADVDQNGVVWTSGFGGVRGFYTFGKHHDPVLNVDRLATATDPVPYAGGTITSPSLTAHVEHNSYHVTQAKSDYTSKTVTASNGVTYNKADLIYATQENVTSCTSTSGGGVGRFVVANLAGSYGGQDWAATTTTANKFFITKLSDYSPKDEPAGPGSSSPGASCSAHWFTVQGDMVAIAFYGNGIRVLDLSDPVKPTMAGYLRIPSATGGQSANNASAAYWHDGYIYIADYTRGIDTAKFTDPIKGFKQPKICWNVCDK